MPTQLLLPILIATCLAIGTCLAAPRDKTSPTKRVLFIVGEREYHTRQTLPVFARNHLQGMGLRCTFICAASDGDDAKRHVFPGLAEQIAEADLLFISVRRRALTPPQLAAVRTHLDAGKPLIGIRTASHAFHTRGKHPEGYVEWERFDPEVFGGNYHGHHGPDNLTQVTIPAGTAPHPILKNVSSFRTPGSLYEVRPLKPGTQVLLEGTIPNAEPEPVAWTRLYKKRARVFYTSLGHRQDFETDAFRTLLANAMQWALQSASTEQK